MTAPSPQSLHPSTVCPHARCDTRLIRYAQDKACIDQNSIQQSLACLPVFLAGCQTLLVVAGPTYCSRLWCVMELFTFVRSGRLLFEPNTACQYASDCAMKHALPTLSRLSPASQCCCSCARVCVTVGGDQRRVEIHLIAHPDDDQTEARRLLLEQFATFDAGKARCFLASDREHLLAVIEAGFGDFYDFNRVARSLLARRVFDRNSSSWDLLKASTNVDREPANLALRLQALARGRSTRAALLGRARAATRLQAAVRGWLVLRRIAAGRRMDAARSWCRGSWSRV